MRTALFTLLICTGVTVGCGGGGGESATDTTTTNPSGTTTSPSTTDVSGTTTTSPTSGTDTTATPGTETTAEPPVTSTTTPPGTETGPGETTAGETGPGETTAGETTAGESTAGESTTGDPPIGGACTKDSDCVLISDCCRCEAASVDDPVPDCPDIQCLIPQCDALNIDEVSCRFGTCVAEKLNCDAATIACDSLPPDCPPGQLPGVNEDNICWTGGCVPVPLCNVVPDCATCPDGQMCVTDETMFGPKIRCEPIPADCGVKPNCECAGEACDNQPFDTCGENPQGLSCSCPVC